MDLAFDCYCRHLTDMFEYSYVDLLRSNSGTLVVASETPRTLSFVGSGNPLQMAACVLIQRV